MKIHVLNVGRTVEPYLKEGLSLYEKRIRRYIPFEMAYLTEKGILSALESIDRPVLLDERGRQMSSAGFSDFLQQAMNRGTRNLGFFIGGPYGFPDEVYHRVGDRISLSPMTFPHQLVRLLFLEQLYRGFTIIRSEPYHHS